MKMTVGELVAKQMEEEKGSATFTEGLLTPGVKEALVSIADIKKKIFSNNLRN